MKRHPVKVTLILTLTLTLTLTLKPYSSHPGILSGDSFS